MFEIAQHLPANQSDDPYSMQSYSIAPEGDL